MKTVGGVRAPGPPPIYESTVSNQIPSMIAASAISGRMYFGTVARSAGLDKRVSGRLF